MKNIHALPTDKPSLYRFVNGILKKYNNVSVVSLNSVHIYITSDEEIKEGDWCIDVIHNTICKRNSDNYRKQYKKIILTTNQDLIKDGVQSIDDEFLEWFVKNPSCEFVEVTTFFSGIDYPYEIIIPKEELHSMDDEVECNMCGGYMYLLPDNSMYVCTNSECTRCYEEEDEEPKQETLEEAAVNCWAEGAWDNRDDFTDGFIEGAKWQQEQDKKMYSEEDMRASYNAENEGWVNFDFWFEQFKNK